MTATLTLAELREQGFDVVDGRAVRITVSGDRTRSPKSDVGASPASPAPDSAPRFRSEAERIYADCLTSRQRAGEIRSWRYEAIKLQLGDRVTYKPDFLVDMWDGSMELHEVKGRHTWEQARVKLRTAANQFPGFRFYMVKVVAGAVVSITPIRSLSGGDT
jgi:hypothetical protein